jgi:integrase
MVERKITLKVPKAYEQLVEDIRLLKSDEQNPNKMTIKQKEQTWKSLQEDGWAYPIVTDLNGVLADGEQRAEVCKDHGEFFAPVLRLELSDADRRILRQRLNKLRGKHNKKLDEADYQRIIEAGERADLEALLLAVGERLPEELGGPKEHLGMIPESYELIIECKDESDQRAKFEKLQAEGYKVKVLNL